MSGHCETGPGFVNQVYSASHIFHPSSMTIYSHNMSFKFCIPSMFHFAYIRTTVEYVILSVSRKETRMKLNKWPLCKLTKEMGDAIMPFQCKPVHYEGDLSQFKWKWISEIKGYHLQLYNLVPFYASLQKQTIKGTIAISNAV